MPQEITEEVIAVYIVIDQTIGNRMVVRGVSFNDKEPKLECRRQWRREGADWKNAKALGMSADLVQQVINEKVLGKFIQDVEKWRLAQKTAKQPE